MKRIDVASLVTGVILIGFSAITIWFISGYGLLAPGRMWFTAVLAVAGVTGLTISLGQRPEDNTHRRRKQ